MDNLTTLCCVGAVIGMLFLFMIPMLLRNLFGGLPRAGANPANSIEPTYDDPNIQGQGSFGRRRGLFGNIRPTYNDPGIRGRGSFGRMFGGLPSRRSGGSKFGGSSGRADSGDIQGRGSFGRDKD